MTRDERIKRYMEILDENDQSNCVRNWNILDRLSDSDLYDKSKIAECIALMEKCEARNENNPNRYPEHIMQYVRQSICTDKYDDAMDEEINKMSPSEVFERVCNWNGLIKYADIIKGWVWDIFKVDLDMCSKENQFQEVK